jgi:hypothetical protein
MNLVVHWFGAARTNLVVHCFGAARTNLVVHWSDQQGWFWWFIGLSSKDSFSGLLVRSSKDGFGGLLVRSSKDGFCGLLVRYIIFVSSWDAGQSTRPESLISQVRAQAVMPSFKVNFFRIPWRFSLEIVS